MSMFPNILFSILIFMFYKKMQSWLYTNLFWLLYDITSDIHIISVT